MHIYGTPNDPSHLDEGYYEARRNSFACALIPLTSTVKSIWKIEGKE
jgi:hypothetical protein